MHATSKEGRQKNPHGVQGVRNNLGIQLKNATGSTYHKETLCTRTTHMLQQSCNNLILLLWKCGKDEDGSAQQRAPFEGQLLLRDSNVHSWQCSIYCVGRRCMHSYRACRRLRQRQEALWAPAQREEKIFTRMVALKERKKKGKSIRVPFRTPRKWGEVKRSQPPGNKKKITSYTMHNRYRFLQYRFR